MAKATKKQARTWALGLIARQGVSLSVDEIEVQLGLSLPALIARFPAEAFCASSLDHVAGIVRYWNEARVVEALTEWARANNAETCVYGPEAEAAPFGLAGKWWIDRFYRKSDDRAVEIHLGMMRTYCPEAFHYMLRHDSRAMNIATWKDWLPAAAAPVHIPHRQWALPAPASGFDELFGG